MSAAIITAAVRILLPLTRRLPVIGSISERPAEPAGTTPRRDRSPRRTHSKTNQDSENHPRENEQDCRRLHVGPEVNPPSHAGKVPPIMRQR